MRMTKRLRALVEYIVLEGVYHTYEGNTHSEFNGYKARDYNDYTEDEWEFVREWIDRKLGI